MRVLSFLFGAVLCLAVPGPAAEGGIDLDLSDVPLRQAVAALFQGSDLQYTIDPDVPDPRLTLRARAVTPAAGLRILLRQAAVAAPGVTQSRDGQVYVIKMRSQQLPGRVPTLPDGVRERTVTFNLREVPLRSALAVLFRGTGILIAVDARVPDVPITLALKEITLQQALRLVLRQAGITAPGIFGSAQGGALHVGFAPAGRPQFAGGSD